MDLRSIDATIFEEEKPIVAACLGFGNNCRDQEELLERAARTWSTKVLFVQVESSSLEAFMKRYNVLGTPTFMLFHRGLVQDRMLGKVDEFSFAGFLSGYLNRNVEEVMGRKVVSAGFVNV